MATEAGVDRFDTLGLDRPNLGILDDVFQVEVRFCDALAHSESMCDSVQAKERLMLERILRHCKYPPDRQQAAVELVLEQVRALGEAWGRAALVFGREHRP